MTAPTGRDQATRDRLAEALPEHQSWCHAEAHGDCCGADDCDCGVADSLERLLPVVAELVREGQAEALEVAAREQRNEAAVVPDTDEGTHADGHRCAADFLDRRADRIRRALGDPT